MCTIFLSGKDNEKSKTLLAGSSLRALASGIAAAKSATSGSAASGKSGHMDSQNWMRWDAERSNRANQDYQREREEIAMRDLLRYGFLTMSIYIPQGPKNCFFRIFPISQTHC